MVETSISLPDLFQELDQYPENLPLDLVVRRLRNLQINLSDLKPFIRFADDTYRRNLIHAGPAYHALILCWRSGQRSQIHDHRGSSCGVRVLKGTCSETIFSRTGTGHIFPTETHKLAEGFCCGSQDADIHQISNLEPEGTDLITLHIYSPPLLIMGKYSLTSDLRAEFADQVHSFMEGAGI